MTEKNSTNNNTKFEEDLATEVAKSHAQMLSQIAGEVEEFCEHPDCTTLQAVILMKCKLREYQIKDIRNKIYNSWKD